MKKTLTITLQIDNDEHTIPYAFDKICAGFWGTYGPDEFVKADLDSELFIDRAGNAPEEVRQLSRYAEFLSLVNQQSIEYNEEMIHSSDSEYYGYAPVYLDGTEIGEVTLTDEITEGKFTGRRLYLFYPHDNRDKGYEATTCEEAVNQYISEKIGGA